MITVATYNERENLPELVGRIRDVVPGADILVIDDNSPDGTGQWCRERQAEDPRLYCIQRPGKLGLGTAAVRGMRYAMEHDYSLLVTMDADLSHLPEQIPDLVARAADADVVVGSRYIAGGRIEGWPWRRRVMSRLVNGLARRLLGLPTRDNSGQFRCYRVARVKQLDLDTITSQGYSFFEEILWRLHRGGAELTEVPITFVERRRGASKLGVAEAVRSVATLVRLGWRRMTS